jgi:hypothetical protein
LLADAHGNPWACIAWDWNPNVAEGGLELSRVRTLRAAARYIENRADQQQQAPRGAPDTSRRKPNHRRQCPGKCHASAGFSRAGPRPVSSVPRGRVERYGPFMTEITVTVVATRTTSDDCGHQYHAVSGRGRTPEEALADLSASALVAARQTAAGFSLKVPTRDDARWRAYFYDRNGAPEWRFEVVDVRLASGPLDSDETGWAAFGTLASREESPSDVGWWDPKPPPTLMQRATRRIGR